MINKKLLYLYIITICLLVTSCSLWGDLENLRPTHRTSHEDEIDENAANLNLPITNINSVVSYLLSRTAGDTIYDPAFLSVQINLGSMTQAGGAWQQLLEAIEEADKYITLDLSACTMNINNFNPDSAILTGKHKIVSLILPDEAITISDVFDSIQIPFLSFTALSSVSGTNIKIIGNYAFSNCLLLTDVNFPLATTIGISAFYNTGLKNADFPLVETIDMYAFYNCTNLTSLYIPAVKIFYQNVFQSTEDTALTITMGLTAPELTGNTVGNCPPEKIITVRIPHEAIGYDNTWQNSFKDISYLRNNSRNINLEIIKF
jgi:hypothetical protein